MNYLCKYAPVELFQSFGFAVSYKNPEIPVLNEEKARLHNNLCSFCRALDQTYIEGNREALLLTNCCNSMESLRVNLEKTGIADYLLDLPYQQNACSIQFYADRIKEMAGKLEEETGRPFDAEAFRACFPKRKKENPRPYIALLGSRLPDSLKNYIESLSQVPLINFTCTGERYLELPDQTEDFDQLMTDYARALLSQRSCMRMEDNRDHRQLINDPFLLGIIFCTVSFCDFYSFEYGLLARECDLPLLSIQTDYTDQSFQQIKTRLEAFFESLGARERKTTGLSTPVLSRQNEKRKGEKEESSSFPPSENKINKGTNKMTEETKIRPGRRAQLEMDYFAGIDSGSSSTNCVILQGKKILASASLPTGVDVQKSARAVLEHCLKTAGLRRKDIRSLVSTGYGRYRIQDKNDNITEISCHAAGAHFLNPKVHTIIDIGGQDSKIIHLDPEGRVKSFAMNDKCAAGTGRFIEMMAMTLNLSLDEMSRLGQNHKKNIKISSMCSVFAQSEVVSLIAEGYSVEDIIHGLNVSVSHRVLALGGGKMEKEFMMTGGVARNAGIRQAIEETLGQKLYVYRDPEICGALGAALLAQEQERQID